MYENIFDTIRELKIQYSELLQQVNELVSKVTNLKLQDLVDVNVENVSAGDALVYQNEKWQPAELSN